MQEGKRAARRPARGSPAGLLLFTGFAFGAAAVALALIPRFAPDFNWAVKKLARMGVTSAPIGAAGCAIFALGLVSRSQSRMLAILNEPSDAELMIEHLAGEFADVRADLREFSTKVTQVQDTARGIAETLRESEAREAGKTDSQDAIFRLAASLDQLGARISQRLEAQHEAVHTALQEIRACIESYASIEAGSPGGIVVAPTGATASSQGHLGLLDHLDDETPAASKTSPSDHPAGAIAYAPVARDLSLESGPRAPLPEPSKRRAPSVPMHDLQAASDNGGVPLEKLDELRSLLSDARIRKVLENIQLD